MKRFVIIDGHAIIHRAYHAIPPMNVKDGTIVNAVFGFTSMLLKTIEELQPDYLAVSFDVAGGTFRDDMYEDYKATRERADQDLYDQIPLVYEVVQAFDIPIFEQEGFEADDVIGTITDDKILRDTVDEIVIVTGDKDLLQLVDDKVKVFLLQKGMSQTALVDANGVKDIFGFGPEHVVDYKAIRGDSSDNIPGIKGIGDKGAKQLIERYGSLENMYKNIDSFADDGFKPGLITKFTDGKSDAEMSKDLATIRRDVAKLGFTVNDTQLHTFDITEVEGVLKKFEFFSLLKRIPGRTSTTKDERQKTNEKKPMTKVTTVDSKKGAEGLIKQIEKEKMFVCREVTSGTDVHTGSLDGFVCIVAETPYYIKGEAVDIFLSVFQKDGILLVGHDLKQLVKVVKVQGRECTNTLFDVMIASYIVNSSTRAHDLKALVMRELVTDLPAASDQGSLFGIDPSIAAAELGFVQELYELFATKLTEEDAVDLFNTIEMPTLIVLAEMEVNGIAIDTKMLDTMSQDVAKRIEAVTTQIHKEAGEEFNVASSVQLREVLYEKMQLPTQGIKKGKTGYSTAASELEKLREYSPIIEMIEEFREIEKLRNTYIDVLPTLINKKTKRIHTSFNQAVAATGRLSSSDPNLQNIPVRTELGRKIRDAFVAEKGSILLAADYSQIELRIAASLSKDKTMINVFQDGKDIHTATAAVMNNVPVTEVTKDMRRAAKAINFGVLYGMGAFGLSAGAGIPQWQAKEFIQTYFERFSGVKKYMDKTLEQAKETGYVETLYGRRRHVPELSSDNYQIRAAGERMAINMPIQGTAADMMKLAMIQVYKEVKDRDDVKLLLQVHDELVLEVTKGKEKEIAALVETAMEGVVELAVPVVVEAHSGTSWGALK